MGLLVEKKMRNLTAEEIKEYPADNGEWYYTINKQKCILTIQHLQEANITIIIAPHKTHPKIYHRNYQNKATVYLNSKPIGKVVSYQIHGVPAVFNPIRDLFSEKEAKANDVVISISQNGSSMWNLKSILDLPIAINEGLELLKPYLTVESL